MKRLEYNPRKVGKSVDEWCTLCCEHLGYVCLIESKIYHILNHGILALNEPYVPGAPRKCIMFRDFAKKCIKEAEEWKLIAWQESLKPLSAGVETAKEDRSTSEPSKEPSSISEWTPTNLESTLAEVAEPGMCGSLMKVFATESNASADAPKDSLVLLPRILKGVKSSGILSGQMEIPNLPF